MQLLPLGPFPAETLTSSLGPCWGGRCLQISLIKTKGWRRDPPALLGIRSGDSICCWCFSSNPPQENRVEGRKRRMKRSSTGSPFLPCLSAREGFLPLFPCSLVIIHLNAPHLESSQGTPSDAFYWCREALGSLPSASAGSCVFHLGFRKMENYPNWFYFF